MFGYRSNERSYNFFNTLQTDFNNYFSSVKADIAKNENRDFSDITDERVYKEIRSWLETDMNMKGGISDIICGFTDSKAGTYGHSKKDYYTDKNISNEAFAHFFEAGMSESSVKIDYIKELFPNSYNTYLEMVNDALRNR